MTWGLRCRTKHISGSPRHKGLKKTHFIKNMRQYDTRNSRYACATGASVWPPRGRAGVRSRAHACSRGAARQRSSSGPLPPSSPVSRVKGHLVDTSLSRSAEVKGHRKQSRCGDGTWPGEEGSGQEVTLKAEIWLPQTRV